jgi:hypothetical protein
MQDADLRSAITLRGNLAVMRIEAFQIVALLQSASGLNTEWVR